MPDAGPAFAKLTQRFGQPQILSGAARNDAIAWRSLVHAAAHGDLRPR
ncbi:MAG: hypothetical protein R2856_18390 [Caldilineaceae bacterium]